MQVSLPRERNLMLSKQRWVGWLFSMLASAGTAIAQVGVDPVKSAVREPARGVTNGRG
jgi:hypothetical protein